jgi:hypothetical protein
MLKTLSMKKIKSLVKPLLIVFIAFLSIQCKDKEPEIKNSTRYNLLSAIDNLMVVASIDFKSLMEKSDFENSPNFNMEMKMLYKMVVKDMIDSDLIGIKLEGNNHFAIGQKDGDNNPLMVFTAPVINPDKIKNGVKDIIKGKYSAPEKKDNYHYIEDKGMCMAWDEKDLILVIQDYGKVDLKAEAKRLLDARYTDAVENAMLISFLERNDDMNVFVDVAKALEIGSQQSGTKLSKEYSETFNNAFYASYGNFEKGSIIFNYELNAPNFSSSSYNFIGNKAVSSDFLNFLSTDNKLIGFISSSININALFDLLVAADPAFEFEISDFEKRVGLNINTLKSAFNGEMSISLVDLILPKDALAKTGDVFMDEFNTPEPEPKIILAFGIKDEATVSTLLDATPELIKKTGYYVANDAFIVLKSGKLVVSTDENVCAQIATGGKLVTYELPSGTAINSPIFGFVNTNTARIPNGMLGMAIDEQGQAALQFLDLFESIAVTGTAEKAEFKVVLKDKSNNSLKVIIDYILASVNKDIEL